MIKKGLDILINNSTEILIMGTFPGEEALRKKEYYANPHNQFWRIMESVLDEKFVDVDYNTRIARLLKHNIGLWNVFATCEREGSMDKDICNPTLQDFSIIKELAPNLKVIIFNGNVPKFAEQKVSALGIRIITLPSTSPANASKPLQDKIDAWSIIEEKVI